MAKNSKTTYLTFERIEDAATFVKTVVASNAASTDPDISLFCKAALELDVEKLGELADASRPIFDLAAKKIHKTWTSAIEVGCDLKKAANMGVFLIRHGVSIVDLQRGRSTKPFMHFAASELENYLILPTGHTENMRIALRSTFANVCSLPEWSWDDFLGSDENRLCENVPDGFLTELARIGAGSRLDAYWPDICLSKAIANFCAESKLNSSFPPELFSVLFAQTRPKQHDAAKYCAYAISHDSAGGLLMLSDACQDFDWTVDATIALDFQDNLVSPCGFYSALHYSIFAHEAGGRGGSARECYKLLSRFEPARISAMKHPWPAAFCSAEKTDVLEALSNNSWLLRPEGMQGCWARSCAEYMEEDFCSIYLAVCETPFESDLTCESKQAQSALAILLSYVRENKKDAFLAKVSVKQRKSLARATTVLKAKKTPTKMRI